MKKRHLRLLGFVFLTLSLVMPVSVLATDDNAPAGKQEAQTFEKEVLVKVKLDYLLYLPKNYEEKPSWPLLVFLHGSGESGRDLNKVKIHGPPKLISEGKEFPFIVVSPQAPRRGWLPQALNGLIDDVTERYKVDKDRIYVTGLSMGGYGTWSLAEAYPDKFAAIVPICGGGDPADAQKLNHLPIWVFHGSKDEAVSVTRSEEMVKALRDAGSTTVDLTIYPGVGHDSWTVTYDNPEVYAWLLLQSRSK